MDDILAQVFMVAPIRCNNQECKKHNKILDVAYFCPLEEDHIYQNYGTEDVDLVSSCDTCGCGSLLDEPYRFLITTARVDDVEFCIRLDLSEIEVERLIDLLKNALEDGIKSKKIYLATDEAFRVDSAFNVFGREIFADNKDGTVELIEKSQLPNRNKVVVVSKEGVALQADVKYKRKNYSVSTSFMPLESLTELATFLKATWHRASTELQVLDEPADEDMPF